MKTVRITIEGITPLMICSFTDEAAQNATAGTRRISNGEAQTPKEQAESFLYRDEHGQPGNILPGPNVLRCITDAGAFHKLGKTKVTTARSSLVPACASVHEILVAIVSREGWTVDTRAVRNPSTGGRRLCSRPLFNDWRLTFHVQLDPTVIGEKLLRDIVDTAGQRIGIGAFRPACKGPFGRFKVTSWKAEAVVLGAAA